MYRRTIANDIPLTFGVEHQFIVTVPQHILTPIHTDPRFQHAAVYTAIAARLNRPCAYVHNRQPIIGQGLGYPFTWHGKHIKMLNPLSVPPAIPKTAWNSYYLISADRALWHQMTDYDYLTTPYWNTYGVEMSSPMVPYNESNFKEMMNVLDTLTRDGSAEITTFAYTVKKIHVDLIEPPSNLVGFHVHVGLEHGMGAPYLANKIVALAWVLEPALFCLCWKGRGIDDSGHAPLRRRSRLALSLPDRDRATASFGAQDHRHTSFLPDDRGLLSSKDRLALPRIFDLKFAPEMSPGNLAFELHDPNQRNLWIAGKTLASHWIRVVTAIVLVATLANDEYKRKMTDIVGALGKYAYWLEQYNNLDPSVKESEEMKKHKSEYHDWLSNNLWKPILEILGLEEDIMFWTTKLEANGDKRNDLVWDDLSPSGPPS
ncbi:hypothetical protein F4778DRAFT_782990 [Xylariomycetidae sp. FL2044]|nr:hypothetical protein F4778DRAFT_782990 [Xylariomycetidae sp. FL2044]